jgi:hypothetical protein
MPGLDPGIPESHEFEPLISIDLERRCFTATGPSSDHGRLFRWTWILQKPLHVFARRCTFDCRMPFKWQAH